MENEKEEVPRTALYARELKRALLSLSRPLWYAFFACIALFITTSLIGLHTLSKNYMVDVPVSGGMVTEGDIGTPRFINPVLAISDADKDLTTLVYSGLLRRNSDGTVSPDAAESYTISKDGLTYTFTLKKDLVFHDGTPLTSADVAFTISAIQDGEKKSPLEIAWKGVVVQTPNPETIVFILKQRYAGFLEGATVGILPAHLWGQLSPEQFSLSDLNIHAIGSGPFKITSIENSKAGIPTLYTLTRNKEYALGAPYLKTLKLRFFENEDEIMQAFTNGSLERIHGINPENADILKQDGYAVSTVVLPRVFGLYLNQNENQIFTDTAVRKAIQLAIDKDAIIKTVLKGYGVAAVLPVPPNVANKETVSSTDSVAHGADTTLAQATLEKAGWKKNAQGIYEKKDAKKKVQTLSFSIATSDAPELKEATNLIVQNLTSIGIQVEVKVFETGALSQSVIRPRKYDALFFGQVVNELPDLFAFWHSSQRKDPGLNIALYTNPKADKLLEDANKTLDEKKRAELYQSLLSEIVRDVPAIFVYHPLFISASHENLMGATLNWIQNPNDRFNNAHEWYVRTERVWKIFAKK